MAKDTEATASPATSQDIGAREARTLTIPRDLSVDRWIAEYRAAKEGYTKAPLGDVDARERFIAAALMLAALVEIEASIEERGQIARAA
jgi:hypothetical protein